ncbi:PAS domain S-box-containing protein [Ruminiclostridium sufflavum DSM 19573]|uniref:histidine kinase n=1 Tax=Ruminiclostridium sufflavum DSM 19573 TaxID=1121337 RepID=A0A318XS41_9FIRM|nr:ATP-binding protein [Ruminiclostridium sufflavum]PYG90344.1 PAS domain S-box-containing protein [Ruminiclostridium sufflavum DSM 19573]
MKKSGSMLYENISETLPKDVSDIISALDKDGAYAIIGNKAKDYFSPTDSLEKAGCTYREGTYYDKSGNELPSKMLPIVQVLNGEKTIQERLVYTSDLGTFYFNLKGSPVYDSEGKQLMGISCSLNVTGQVKNNKKLVYPVNILEIANDAIVAFDSNHKLTYMNPAAELMYGWTAAEAIDKTSLEILQLVFSEDDKFKLQSKSSLSDTMRTEYIHHRKDGSSFWVETTSRAYYDKYGHVLGYVVVGHDITARKQAEKISNSVKERLTQELALKNRLHAVSEQSTRKGSIKEVLDEIIETVIEFTNAAACCIHLLDDQAKKISVMAHYGLDEASLKFFSKAHNFHKLYEQILKIKERIIIEDISQSNMFIFKNDIPNISMLSNRTIQFTPLISRSGQLLGILSTQYRPHHHLEEWENSLLDMLARLSLDIIEHLQYEMNKELLIESEREKNEALQKSIEMKDEFLALISHEFKTPLTVINSAIQAMELLCREELSPKARSFISKIRQNSYRQLRLVNNLLDITRFNSGQMKLNQSNEDIVFLTKSITDSVQLYAQQSGIKLKFSSTLKQKEIGIDEEKYERILLNLLSNAIKFTPKGKSINVRVSQKIVNQKRMICIQVKDNGIGIPSDKVNVIFERFGQVDNSLTRQAEGTGIGLSLVKMLVESQKGIITLESKEGCGSSFSLLFPAKKIRKTNSENIKCGVLDNRLIQATAVEFSDIYI